MHARPWIAAPTTICGAGAVPGHGPPQVESRPDCVHAVAVGGQCSGGRGRGGGGAVAPDPGTAV